jgi:nitrite reductase/ring-hydroxylating ferredoxin subunit
LTSEQRVVGSSLGRVKVAGLNEIPEGGSKIITVKDRMIALFRFKDQYFAIANNCLHRGGPLGEGEVKDYEVTCPWHGWRYSLMDGSLSLIPTLRVKTYKVEQNSEGIFIEE